MREIFSTSKTRTGNENGDATDLNQLRPRYSFSKTEMTRKMLLLRLSLLVLLGLFLFALWG